MKPYAHIQEFEIPIYGGHIIVILSNSKKKVKNLLPEFNSDEFHAHCYHTNWNGGNGYALIFNTDSKISDGIIAHESLHACHMLFKQYGIFADQDNDEPMAYLLQWIVDRVVHVFSKTNHSLYYYEK